jgi:hypothetical protein
MQAAIRPVVTVVLIILSVLGLINVYGDNTDVLAEAHALACPGCEATLRQVERTPISQTFHFMTDKSGMAIVKCSRSAIFLGAYSCEKR